MREPAGVNQWLAFTPVQQGPGKGENTLLPFAKVFTGEGILRICGPAAWKITANHPVLIAAGV